MNALDYNYAALAVAILKECTVEHAFDLLENPNLKKCLTKHTDEDIEDMIRLKQTHTYKQVAELYGLSENAVYKKIKRYKERKRA